LCVPSIARHGCDVVFELVRALPIADVFRGLGKFAYPLFAFGHHIRLGAQPNGVSVPTPMRVMS